MQQDSVQVKIDGSLATASFRGLYMWTKWFYFIFCLMPTDRGKQRKIIITFLQTGDHNSLTN